MEMGILGLPLSGKTTIFSLLTGVTHVAGRKHGEAARGVGFVADDRVDRLAEIFHSQKTIYATLNLLDLPSLDLASDRRERNRVLQHVQNSDALLLVVRAFADEAVAWPGRYTDAAAQLEALTTELLVRDLEVAETRIANLAEQAKRRRPTVDEQLEQSVLERVLPALEEERPVGQLGLTAEELKIVSSCGFFTAKPSLAVVNLDEDQLAAGDYPSRERLEQLCRDGNLGLVTLAGRIEAEIESLGGDERAEFLAALGLDEPGITRLARAAYTHLGLISFLTVGEDEVRAWTIARGTGARSAAGKIHTDFERKFVRAEVIPYDVFMTYRSLPEARTHGQIRVVGKDEIIQDGDIVNVLAGV